MHLGAYDSSWDWVRQRVLENAPTLQRAEEMLDKFASTGVKIHWSEVDLIEICDFNQQAQQYVSLFKLALKEKYRNVFERFTFWGTADHLSWWSNGFGDQFNLENGNEQYPLLYDSNYNPKPAYWEVINLGRSAIYGLDPISYQYNSNTLKCVASPPPPPTTESSGTITYELANYVASADQNIETAAVGASVAITITDSNTNEIKTFTNLIVETPHPDYDQSFLPGGRKYTGFIGSHGYEPLINRNVIVLTNADFTIGNYLELDGNWNILTGTGEVAMVRTLTSS